MTIRRTVGNCNFENENVNEKERHIMINEVTM